MLNIGRLGGDLDAVVAYYAADVEETKTSATAEYYAGHESGGRWVGLLQSELGVGGAVGGAEFRRLLEGLHPNTGNPPTLGLQRSLSRPDSDERRPITGMFSVTEAAKHLNVGPRHVRKLLERGASTGDIGNATYLKGEQRHRGRGRWKVPAAEVNRILNERSKASTRPGFDLTLRPPKSVSILWALGTPEITKAVADAHRQAVDEVVHYYEEHAVFSRKRVRGDQMRISTRGLIGAAFDHRTSRAGDPLLHTHVVVFNATLCSDGEWRSIEAPTLYEHAKTGGYLYQVHLRHVLAKTLGVSWTPTVNGVAEIEGVSPMLIDHFSKRRDEIETAAAIAGHSSAGAFQVATLQTRKTKSAGAEPPVEISRWRKEAQDLGFDLSQLTTPAKTQAVDDRVEVGVETFAEMSGSNGLTKMTSTFAERDVIRELAQRTDPGLGARQVCDLATAFVSSTNPIHLQGKGRDDDRTLLGDSIVREASVTRYATAELFGKEADLLSWASIALKGGGATANVEALSRYQNLSDEQRWMVRSVAESGRRLHLITGHPGSGKTYAMQVAVEAFSRAGVRVVGAAVSAQAADELESSVNFRELQWREATTISALLADLSSPNFGGLVDGTVLVLDEASMIGTRQLHQLVQHLDDANGSLVLLGDPNQHGSVEAGGIYRHLVEDHVEHVVALKANNRQSVDTDRRAIDAFRDREVKKAINLYDSVGNVIRSDSQSDSLDAMVRDWVNGWVEGERSPMLAGRNETRRDLNMRARGALAAAGMLSGETLTADGKDFRVGDWVVARRNKAFVVDGVRRPIRNGSVGSVVEVQRDSLTIEFDKEGRISLPQWYLDDHGLDHAYARTTYGVQGKTMNNALYQPTDVSSFEEGYVAITRAKKSTRMYLVDTDSSKISTSECRDLDFTDDVEKAVARALSKRRAKSTAHEIEIDMP